MHWRLVRLLQLASPRCRSAPTAIRRGSKGRSRRASCSDAASASSWIGDVLDIRDGALRGAGPAAAAAASRATPTEMRRAERAVSRQPRNRRVARRDACRWVIRSPPAARTSACRAQLAAAKRAVIPCRVRVARPRAGHRCRSDALRGVSVVLAREPGAGRDEGGAARPDRRPDACCSRSGAGSLTSRTVRDAMRDDDLASFAPGPRARVVAPRNAILAALFRS